MTQKPLYRSLDANLALLEEMFGRSDDFYTKRLMLAGIPCAIVMFTGLSSPEKLCRMALDMLDRDPAMLGGGEGLCDYLLTQSRVPAEPDAVEDCTALVELLSNGLSVLLIDGVRRGVAFSTQEMPQRSISTPMSEGNLRGPQEAFTELLRNNISLLRRQFRTGTLVAEISTARTRAKTEYCLCYDSTLAPKETIDALRERLEQVEIPVLLDSAYFASFLKQDKLNLFPAAAYTERPATACARLCEGKAVVLVAGCPYALIVPSFFAEHFECLDDYASGAVFAGLIRILKYLAFLLAVFGPINRLHSTDSPFNGKEPWNFSAEVRDSMVGSLRLRHMMLPYLYTMNYRAAFEGMPLVEPMYWADPNNPQAYEVPDEFRFGTELLVAPIVSDNDDSAQLGSTEAWLPQGEWYDFFDGRRYVSAGESGRRLEVWRAIDRMPVFAKAGGIVPLQQLGE